MAVYVDTAYLPYGRMIMCHMLADTTTELLKMADLIDLSHRHLQRPGTPYEHFDVSKLYRARAVANGAIEITPRDAGRMVHERRKALGDG